MQDIDHIYHYYKDITDFQQHDHLWRDLNSLVGDIVYKKFHYVLYYMPIFAYFKFCLKNYLVLNEIDLKKESNKFSL